MSFLVLLLIAGCEKSSSDWVKYKTDEDGNVYSYNKGSIKVDSENNSVQLLAKEIYSDVGKTIELQSRIKDGLSVEEYGNFSYKTCLYEIDCRKNSIAILTINHFDKHDKIIYAGGETKEKNGLKYNLIQRQMHLKEKSVPASNLILPNIASFNIGSSGFVVHKINPIFVL